jgi:uncharacterized membrane protein YoaK (UPF0700 family)
LSTAIRVGAAAVLALALGLQNVVVRALAVPDLTTTVLTTTLTGLLTDISTGVSPAVVRRFLSVATMFAGAVAGAGLVLRVSAVAGLGAAIAVLLVVTIAADVLAGGDSRWHQQVR